MKAEGSLLKPAQHTDGMDAAFFLPELSRGSLCFTKFVKCCASLNKRLKLTVNLSSRPASACRTTLVKGHLCFSLQENLLILQFECFPDVLCRQWIHQIWQMMTLTMVKSGECWSHHTKTKCQMRKLQLAIARWTVLVKLIWQLVPCCSLLTCSGGQTQWWPQPKVSTSLDNPGIQRKWRTSWRKL